MISARVIKALAVSEPAVMAVVMRRPVTVEFVAVACVFFEHIVAPFVTVASVTAASAASVAAAALVTAAHVSIVAGISWFAFGRRRRRWRPKPSGKSCVGAVGRDRCMRVE